MMPLLWILDANHEPQPAPDAVTWANWLGVKENRIVKQEAVGPYFVSTVFCGINVYPVSKNDTPPRDMFETAIFLNRELIENGSVRADTWDEALYLHAGAVKAVRRKLG